MQKIFVCLIFIFVLIISSCDNIVGLGSKVNTETPVIKIPDDPGGVSAPGSFLSGSKNIIYMDASINMEGFNIKYLYLTIEYLDKEGQKRSETIAGFFEKETEKWAINIDTIDLNMEDGKFTSWATAIDTSGKKTVSTDIIYYVKNLPPQIQLTIPAVKTEDFNNPKLNEMLQNETIYIGMDLMGIATDNLGIAKGFPKIMIWPSGIALNKDYIPIDAKYNNWHEMPGNRNAEVQTSCKFTWPMYELIFDADVPGHYRLPSEKDIELPVYLKPGEYQFKIWIQDIRGKNNFYPHYPNEYIKIKYTTADIPIISFTDVPAYCNGNNDFTLRFNVTSSTILSKLEAFVRDSDSGAHTYSVHYTDNSLFNLINHNGNTYTYELKIPANKIKNDLSLFKNGNLYIYLSAEDSNQRNSPIAYRNFIYDTESANIKFERPVNITVPKFKGKLINGKYEIYYPSASQGPKWITGETQVSALTTDSYGIKEIYYYIGKLGDDKAASDAARELIYNDANWKNTFMHTPNPVSLDEYGGRWGGTVYAWNYTCNFNNLKDAANLIQEESELSYSVNDPEYKTTGEPRFYLPFYVKITDNADNVTITHYKLCVDPNLDIPMVNINYPADLLVGGEIRLSGIASDNDAVHSVQIRIKKYDSSLKNTFKYYIPQGTNAFYPNSSYPVFAHESDSSGWFKANLIGDGNLVNWFCNINSDGGLDPHGTETQAFVTFQIRAFDTKDLIHHIIPDKVGPVTSMDVIFSAGIPTISNPVIKRQGLDDAVYTENLRVSGEFKITAILRDDDGIRNVRVRFNGENYIKLVEERSTLSSLPAGWEISEEKFNPNFNKYERVLSITVDTINTKNFPSLGYGKTGNMIMDIQVTDMNSNSFTSNAQFKFGIDNFYPSLIIDTHNRASGVSFKLQGTARDYNSSSGSIQGLERVLVYFEKAQITGASGSAGAANRKIIGTGEFFNQHGVNWKNLGAAVTYPHVRDTTIADGYGGAYGPNTRNFANFPALKLTDKGNLGMVWESEHAMVIDRQELDENADIDMDGTFGEVWDGTIEIDWMARFNTTKNGFSDGPLLVHYIVIDKALNAARYISDIYIENNKPLITHINLGTDIDGNEDVEAWKNSDDNGEFFKEKQTIGLTSAASSKINFGPEFRVRNNRFTLMLDTIGGNGTKEYRVSYVTQNPIPVSASNLERGKVYTITEHGGIDWVRYGAPNNNLNTTFTATGRHAGITSARAISYNEQRTKSGAFTGNEVKAINFTDADFGLEDKGLIPDSIKDSSGVILAANQNKRMFIVSVYDSTVAQRPREDQNAHSCLFAVDIDNIDSKMPEIFINPFHWNSVNDNSLYENSKENGHIELESDLPQSKFTIINSGVMDRDPKVSGIISIRGTAFDNNNIEKILFTVANNKEETAAVFNPKANGGWQSYGSLEKNNAWQFKILKAEYDAQGHQVEWQLDIDTSKITQNVTGADIVLKVSANDKNEANTSAPSYVQTTTNKKTSYYRMDIVPYITKVSTSNRSAGALRDQNIRSADGKYSVRRDNKNIITIEGFNLNPAGANGGVYLLSSQYNETQFNPVSNPPATGQGVTKLSVSRSRNFNSLQIDNTENSNSGFLTIWTNGIAVLNNINNNEARGNFKLITSGSNSANGYNEENMPNREADRFTTKNITLTDDRYIQFYHVVDTKISNSSFPVMLMNGNNPVFGYLKDNGGPSSAAGNNAGTGAGSLNPTYAVPQRREVNGVTGDEIYTEYLIKGSMWDGMGMTRDESGRFLQATTFARDQSTFHLIYDRFCELYTPASGFGWGTGVSFGTGGLFFAHQASTNTFSLETVNYTGKLNIFRYQYPKLYAKGNSNTAAGAVFYLLYFDEVTKELAFRNFKIINNNSATPPANWIHLSNTGSDMANNTYNFNHTNMRGYDGAGFAPTSGVPSNQYDNARSLEARKKAADNASRFFDLAVTDDNHVIVIYYDEAVSRLKLRYSKNEIKGEAPTADIDWEDSSVNFPINVGTYVSLVCDGSSLHISANDSSAGDLIYIFVPDYKKADYRAVAVDKYGTTGNWTDIKLKPGTSGEKAVPYIAYFNMADIGSRDSNKIAWLKQGVGKAPAAGSDSNGFTTGKWEYAVVPAINAPAGGSNKFQKVNLGFRLDNTPIIGYLASNIEFAYPVGE